jgi:hypothetical protein
MRKYPERYSTEEFVDNCELDITIFEGGDWSEKVAGVGEAVSSDGS